jgi:hypothetical protein
MKNKNGSISFACMAVAVLLYALLPIGASVAAKEKSPKDAVYWQPSQIPHFLLHQYQALGDRLEKSGNERISLTGTLVDSSGSNSVKLVIEKGGKVKIDKSSKNIKFDGQSFSSNLNQNDKDLLESFSDDLPDTLIEAVASGNGFRFLGQRFIDKKGESCDYYDAPTPAKINTSSAPQLRRYCFDSNTKLLSWVQYQSGNGKNASIVETHFSDWTVIKGQAVAGTVSRIKNGTPVFTFQAKDKDVSASADDNLFKP